MQQDQIQAHRIAGGSDRQFQLPRVRELDPRWRQQPGKPSAIEAAPAPTGEPANTRREQPPDDGAPEC